MEDVRHALPENSLESSIQKGIDSIVSSMDSCIGELAQQDNNDTIDAAEEDSQELSHVTKNIVEDTSPDDDDERLVKMPDSGGNIEIYWPLDDTLYHGTVSSPSMMMTSITVTTMMMIPKRLTYLGRLGDLVPQKKTPPMFIMPLLQEKNSHAQDRMFCPATLIRLDIMYFYSIMHKVYIASRFRMLMKVKRNILR